MIARFGWLFWALIVLASMGLAIWSMVHVIADGFTRSASVALVVSALFQIIGFEQFRKHWRKNSDQTVDENLFFRSMFRLFVWSVIGVQAMLFLLLWMASSLGNPPEIVRVTGEITAFVGPIVILLVIPSALFSIAPFVSSKEKND